MDPMLSLQDLIGDLKEVKAMIKFWMDVVVTSSVGTFGCLANLLVLLFMIFRKKMSTFHQLMISLFFYDLIYLVFWIFSFGVPHVAPASMEADLIYFIPFGLCIAQAGVFGSCYTILSLTVERYYSVCLPFQRRLKNLKAWRVILLVFLLAFFYNLVRFFEWDLERKIFYNCTELVNKNLTLANKILMINEKTYLKYPAFIKDKICASWETIRKTKLTGSELRDSPIYIILYLNVLNTVVNFIGPFCALAILNTKIYNGLQQSKPQSVLLGYSSVMGCLAEGDYRLALLERRRQHDAKLARISVIIVLFFTFCHFPRMLPNVYEMFVPVDQVPEWVGIWICVCNLLQVFYSSTNCILFTCLCYNAKDLKGTLQFFAFLDASKTSITNTPVITADKLPNETLC